MSQKAFPPTCQKAKALQINKAKASNKFCKYTKNKA